MFPHLIRDEEESSEPSDRSDGELSSDRDDESGSLSADQGRQHSTCSLYLPSSSGSFASSESNGPQRWACIVILHLPAYLTSRPILQLVLTDFELAIRSALPLVFENFVHKGCYYHFCQALMKHIKEMGMWRLYNNDLVLQEYLELADQEKRS
jgi:hypothetical protein